MGVCFGIWQWSRTSFLLFWVSLGGLESNCCERGVVVFSPHLDDTRITADDETNDWSMGVGWVDTKIGVGFAMGFFTIFNTRYRVFLPYPFFFCSASLWSGLLHRG